MIEVITPSVGFDPERDYGIIPEQPKPLDILYRLEYDADKGCLKLNSFVVQTFKWGAQRL